ncbi:hypothetical protein JB92DRAFT_2836600 [Gautieria morchelliformis]|nr:hypothetical protein JB92DRAFT_2836600 [Gautieria morchelliformis]
MKIVHSAIATHLMNARNLIKIHAIIFKSKAKLSVTAHIQMHLTFLASLCTALRDSEAAPDKMWLTIDKMLREWEITYAGKEALVEQMKMNLLVDQEDFKHPQDENVIL